MGDGEDDGAGIDGDGRTRVPRRFASDMNRPQLMEEAGWRG